MSKSPALARTSAQSRAALQRLAELGEAALHEDPKPTPRAAQPTKSPARSTTVPFEATLRSTQPSKSPRRAAPTPRVQSSAPVTPSISARAWPPRQGKPSAAAAPPATALASCSSAEPPPFRSSAPAKPSARLPVDAVTDAARGQLVTWLRQERSGLQQDRAALAWLLQAQQRCARDMKSGMEQVQRRLALAEEQELERTAQQAGSKARAAEADLHALRERLRACQRERSERCPTQWLPTFLLL